MFEAYAVTFEIYNKDKVIQRQTMQAPKEILMINFIQTMNQIIEDKRPLKIKMIRPDVIWDRFENKEKVLNNEISFSNLAMVSWEEGK